MKLLGLLLGLCVMLIPAPARSDDAQDMKNRLLEKAWACDPVLHTEKIVNWQFRQIKKDGQLESIPEGYARLYQTLFEFQGCRDDEPDRLRRATINLLETGVATVESLEQLRDVFIERYIARIDSTTVYGYHNIDDDFRKGTDYSRPPINWEEVAGATVKVWLKDTYNPVHIVYNRPDPDPDDKLHSRNYHQAYQLRKDMQRYIERQTRLRDGEIPVANFDDAMMFYEPMVLQEIMGSPLLKPDKELYAQRSVVVDGVEGKNLLRVKLFINSNWQGQGSPIYALVKGTKNTTDYSKGSMRIGKTIHVIGRYLKNTTYRTIAGETKLMPVIELICLGD